MMYLTKYISLISQFREDKTIRIYLDYFGKILILNMTYFKYKFRTHNENISFIER